MAPKSSFRGERAPPPLSTTPTPTSRRSQHRFNRGYPAFTPSFARLSESITEEEEEEEEEGTMGREHRDQPYSLEFPISRQNLKPFYGVRSASATSSVLSASADEQFAANSEVGGTSQQPVSVAGSVADGLAPVAPVAPAQVASTPVALSVAPASRLPGRQKPTFLTKVKRSIPRRPVEPEWIMCTPPSRLPSSSSNNNIVGPAMEPGTSQPSNLRQAQTVSDLSAYVEEDVEEDLMEGRGARHVKFSRIPSPTIRKAADRSAGRRFVSAPIMPSQKENVEPKHLLRPVSPTSSRLPIKKSSTMSRISGAFQRRSFSSRFSSSFSSRSAKPAVVAQDMRSLTPPNSSPHQVYSYKDEAYWLGRVMGLSNHYQNEMLQLMMNDPTGYQAYLVATASPTKSDAKKNDKKKTRAAEQKDEINYKGRTPPHLSTQEEYTSMDEASRLKRAFEDLGAFCNTEAAKQSLWDFQQKYARAKGMPSLLPEGGKMADSLAIFSSGGKKDEKK